MRLHLHGQTWLVADGLEVDGQAQALPDGAIAAVFARYGKPLEDGIEAPPPVLDGVAILSFMRWGDVEPQAYAVRERQAVPAPLLAAALRALAAARRAGP